MAFTPGSDCKADTAPERAPGHPGLVVLVDDEVGVDGIPVVAQAL